jgi:hypothetical protein
MTISELERAKVCAWPANCRASRSGRSCHLEELYADQIYFDGDCIE